MNFATIMFFTYFSGISACLSVQTVKQGCPEGFDIYNRTPNASNNYTSVWCMQVVILDEPIPLSSAKNVCAQYEALPTAYENQEEYEKVYLDLQIGFNNTNLTNASGAMAVDGRRFATCHTDPDTPPCDNVTTSFEFMDYHTDHSFFFTTFMDDEPSKVDVNGRPEDCIQFLSSNADEWFKGMLNDHKCDVVIDPQWIPFSNYAVLCGRLPV